MILNFYQELHLLSFHMNFNIFPSHKEFRQFHFEQQFYLHNHFLIYKYRRHI